MSKAKSPHFVCQRGHVDNLYVNTRKDGWTRRECRACRNLSSDKYKARNPEQTLRIIQEAAFGRNRENAIQRDGECCVNCGMTRGEHRIRYKRDITVDHIDLNGSGKPPHLRNNALENLQTMCLPCHVKKDAKLRKELYGHVRQGE